MISDPRAVGEVSPGVFRFTRSRTRIVLDSVVLPIGAVAFLALAVFMAAGGMGIGVVMFGFFGVIMALGSFTTLRSGVRSTVFEVTPDGIWTSASGRLGWREIAEVRLESMRGIGGGDSMATTRYRRVGVVPRDASLADDQHAQRAATVLVNAYLDFVRRLAPESRLAPIEMAPFGVTDSEIREPIDAVVAAVRRYATVVDADERRARERAPIWAARAREGPATPPITDAEIRAIDARLEPGAALATAVSAPASLAPAAPLEPGAAPATAVSAPASLAPAAPLASASLAPAAPLASASLAPAAPLASASLVPRTDPISAGPPPRATFVRPGGGLSPLLSAIAPVVVVAVGAVAGVQMLSDERTGPISWIAIPLIGILTLLTVSRLVRIVWRIRRSSGPRETLEVGPDGIWVPGLAGPLPWTSVATIRTERASSSAFGQGQVEAWRIVVEAAGTAAAGTPGAGAAVAGPPAAAQGGQLAVRSDDLDAPFDDVLDLIRYYHPVIEGG